MRRLCSRPLRGWSSMEPAPSFTPNTLHPPPSTLHPPRSHVTPLTCCWIDHTMVNSFLPGSFILSWECGMRSLLCGGGVLAVFLLAGLVSGPAGASSDDEPPSIKKLMGKLHKGKVRRSMPSKRLSRAMNRIGPKSRRTPRRLRPWVPICPRAIRRAARRPRTKNSPRPTRLPANRLRNRPRKKISAGRATLPRRSTTHAWRAIKATGRCDGMFFFFDLNGSGGPGYRTV